MIDKIIVIVLYFIYILFCSAVILTPIALSFLLYRWLKKKSKYLKILGFILLCCTTLFMSYQAYKLLTEDVTDSFGPHYETVEIPQDIGGSLICNSVHTSDFHSFDYDITYKYEFDDDSIYYCGTGSYQGVNWKKNEQFLKYGKWIILKIPNSRDSDKLIIGNIMTKQFNEFVFSPENIEREVKWIECGIETRLDNWDTVSKILDIDSNGYFTVKYTYRKEGKSPFKNNGRRKLIYQIDKNSGKPELKSIEKK